MQNISVSYPIKQMNLLIIGSGGREHAITYKLSQSKHIKTIFVAPGNGGTQLMSDNIKNVNISEKKHDELIEFAKKNVF